MGADELLGDLELSMDRHIQKLANRFQMKMIVVIDSF
jgi:hypothetical protein